MAITLAVISCLVSGYLIVALGLRHCARWQSELLLRISLSAGYGLGLFSLIFFLARVLGTTHVLAIDIGVTTLLLAAFLLPGTRSVVPHASISPQESIDVPRWLQRVLAAGLAIALFSAAYAAILRSIVHPHGDGWDAFAIWNLHARFLFRGGEYWRDGFSALIPWSHPDYPFLLPSAIAHFWSILGRENSAVPAIIGLAFTFSTLGLLFSSLDKLRGRNSAILGTLALASTPFFVEQGSSQCADVPLSFFFLAAMSLLHLHSRRADETDSPSHSLLVVSGVAAGFAVWTKNEGMLFLCAMIGARVLGQIRQSVKPDVNELRSPADTWVDLSAFSIAVAPLFLLIAWFKHSIAFSNELFSDRATMLHRLVDPGRYWAIVKWFAKDFLRFGEWWLIPGTLLLVCFYFMLRGKYSTTRNPAIRASQWTLALTLAGCFAIYVITPYDLYWHLRFSLNRLFLQLWPCAIFLFFVSLPGPARKTSQNDP